MNAQELLLDAREQLADGKPELAWRSAAAACMADDELRTWLAADRLLGQTEAAGARRSCKVAVLSSHTGSQLTAALRAAAAVHGLAMTTYESGYRTFEQEILDSDSPLYRFAPDVVLIAADQREVRLPEVSSDPEADLSREVGRWAGLWERLSSRSTALIVQLTFVPPSTDALGQHGAVHPGGRRRLLRRLNLALGDRTPPGVHLVDLEAVGYEVGRPALENNRYWYRSKHAIGLAATTAVARATADVIASALGLGRKLVVVDLDNTLWGGVIGEDGLAGLELGDGPSGEAFADLQRYLRSLRERGLLLAVSTKNNESDALLPFERHPEMILTTQDFVAIRASWDPKPEMVRQLTADLGLGLESVVFVDDNPVERAAMRHALPQVGVVELPSEPSGFVDAVARFPGLQTVSVSAEDVRRTAQYRARTQARSLEKTAGSRQDYLAELQMVATLEPLDETNLGRITQLIGKTNQFNLTVRRHSAGAVQDLSSVSRSLTWGLRLRDRFDDHGLVAVVIAVPDQQDSGVLVIDTFVMSCRVLGRTVEQTLLAQVAEWARAHGYRAVLGHFVPADRNAPARSTLPDAGYRRVTVDMPQDLAQHEDVESWRLELGAHDPVNPHFIAVAQRDGKKIA